MTLVGWLLIGAGGMVIWSGISGINPLDEVRSIFTHGGKPAKDPSLVIGNVAHGAIAGEPNSTGNPVGTVAGTATAVSGVRAKVIQVAEQQLGKPYKFATAGPNTFDCSGLVKYVYQQAANITLPHFSGAIAAMGHSVKLSDSLPGDIVCFFNPVSHVGILTSPSTMIVAPDVGENVQVQTVDVKKVRTVRNLLS